MNWKERFKKMWFQEGRTMSLGCRGCFQLVEAFISSIEAEAVEREKQRLLELLSKVDNQKISKSWMREKILEETKE